MTARGGSERLAAVPAPALIAWIVGAPFAVVSAIAGSHRLRTGVLRRYRTTVALGWIGFGLVAAGAVLQGRPSGTMALLVGAPLLGLCVWVRRGADDGDARPAPAPDSGNPPDAIDWDRFMLDLAEWSATRDREGTRSTARK
jgi:hypothetical protein